MKAREPLLQRDYCNEGFALFRFVFLNWTNYSDQGSLTLVRILLPVCTKAWAKTWP